MSLHLIALFLICKLHAKVRRPAVMYQPVLDTLYFRLADEGDIDTVASIEV